MKVITLLFFTFLYGYTARSQLGGSHIWQKLETSSGEKIWYGVISTDALKQNKFDIWLLKVLNPLIKSGSVNGEDYGCQTLYSVNLVKANYSISKTLYNDRKNNELYGYDYASSLQSTDELIYPYSILEEAPFCFVVQDISSATIEKGN